MEVCEFFPPWEPGKVMAAEKSSFQMSKYVWPNFWKLISDVDFFLQTRVHRGASGIPLWEPLESQIHFGLQCSVLAEIRSQYMDKFSAACPNITKYLSDNKLLLLALLDPFSNLLPTDISQGWRSASEAYELSRNYFYALHKKREKFIKITQPKQTNPENEHVSDLIISVYKNI